jgi:hypothetical protein
MLDTTSRVDPASLFDDNKPRCDQCGEPFEPRTGNGGKPQRFCSSECRIAFHNEPQRGQRSPTCIASTTLPAVIPPKPKDAPQATPEDLCWSVPHQSRIECSATMDDEIEIEQLSPLGESENTRIFVARSNAVQLARNILYATGFKGVMIATTDGGGGYSDVEDGGLPEHFAGRP